MNRTRVQRLYREEGLAVRRKGRRRRSQAPRPVRDPLGQPDERWSLDVVSDTLSSGRTFRCLTVIDELSRECLALYVAHSIPAVHVIQVLERLREERGLPDRIICDYGSEFTSRAFDAWAYSRDVKIEYIQPGKSVQNCFVESFTGSFRDECLNPHWFLSLGDAKKMIQRWKRDYNRVRPHSAPGHLPPAEFALNHHPGFRE